MTWLSVVDRVERWWSGHHGGVENGQVALETERLILREMVEDDLEALLKVLGDAEAMVRYPAPFTQQWVSEWISWSRGNYSEHGCGLWAVVLKATGDVIGGCGLTWQRVGYSQERQLEAGWHVRRDLWG